MNETKMMKALQGSSLHALLMMTSKALSRAGFGDVQLLDRRQNKQKSRFGGHELLCQTMVGDVPVRIIVKIVRDTFRIRMFDELSGAVQRMKADFGILVSPHQSNEKFIRLQDLYAGTRIIPLDGSGLVKLLYKHQIGIRKSGEPDYAFLTSLEEFSLKVQNFNKEVRHE